VSAPEALVSGAQQPYARVPGATEVLLVRHGASARDGEGADRLLRGIHADPPLAQLGEQQARRVAERLARLRVDHVFVSPLRRTAQTAAPLLALTGGRSVEIEGLREVYLGELEGAEFERRRALGDPLVASVFDEQRWDVIPGAEAMGAFGDRVFGALETVADLAGPDTTAIAFSHAAVIAAICARIAGSLPLAFVGNENAAITTVIRYAPGRWQMRSFNDTAHLP
jgi:2,3-bisphosphoglycerate-dependent phosphoglycerate mutase